MAKKKSKRVKVDQVAIDFRLERLSEKTKKRSSPVKKREIEAAEKTLEGVKPRTRFDRTSTETKRAMEKQKLRESINREKFGRPYPTAVQRREVERKRKLAKGKAAVKRVSAKNKAAVRKKKPRKK